MPKLSCLNQDDLNTNKAKSSVGGTEWKIKYKKGFSVPYDLVEDKDGNIYFTGQYDIYGGNRGGFFLFKYNKNGKQIWNKTMDSPKFELGRSLFIDDNNFLYVAGHFYNPSGNSFILKKYNLNGELLFAISPKESVGGISVQTDSKGNIYVACDGLGSSNIKRDFEFGLFKYDKNGQYLWHNIWGGKGEDRLYSLTIDTSDNIYVAGRTVSFGKGGMEAYVAKYSSKGDMLWEKKFGSDKDDSFYSIYFNNKGDLVLIGELGSSNFEGDVFIVIMDKYGILKEAITWGDPEKYDMANGACIDTKDNIYVYGRSYTDFIGAYIVKFNRFGKYVGIDDLRNYSMLEIVDMRMKQDGSFLILSISNRFDRNNVIYLLKHSTIVSEKYTRFTNKPNRILILQKGEVVFDLLISSLVFFIFFSYFFKLKIYPKLLRIKTNQKEYEMIEEIKRVILDISTKLKRIKIEELSERIGIRNKKLMRSIIKDMIDKKEVYGEIFFTSDTIVFDRKVNNEEIQNLLDLYEEWEEDKHRKK
jgi:hypothetical protein